MQSRSEGTAREATALPGRPDARRTFTVAWRCCREKQVSCCGPDASTPAESIAITTAMIPVRLVVAMVTGGRRCVFMVSGVGPVQEQLYGLYGRERTEVEQRWIPVVSWCTSILTPIVSWYTSIPVY